MCKGPEVDRAWVEVVWREHGVTEGQKMRWEAAEQDQAGSVSHEELRFFSRRKTSKGFLEKIKKFKLLYVDRPGEQFGGSCN